MKHFENLWRDICLRFGCTSVPAHQHAGGLRHNHMPSTLGLLELGSSIV